MAASAAQMCRSKQPSTQKSFIFLCAAFFAAGGGPGGSGKGQVKTSRNFDAFACNMGLDI
jgi:hypothetical protein